MFIAFIIILVSLIAFDLGTKYIWGFYLLVFFSNYINFLGLNYLVRKLNSPERKILRRRTNFYFMLMNLLYMFNFVMTFTETFGPWCTKTHLYPEVMSYSSWLFVINFFFHCYMHYQNYWLRWEEHPRMKFVLGREKELGWEPIDKLKPMFLMQMKVFLVFQALTFGVILAIHFLIRVYIDKKSFLGCSANGLEWIYLRVEGSMFLLLHMSLLCVQAVMIEKVFYGVPKAFGYYDNNEPEDE
jgi:hypothetical protein